MIAALSCSSDRTGKEHLGSTRGAVITGSGACRTATLTITSQDWQNGYTAEAQFNDPMTVYIPQELPILRMGPGVDPALNSIRLYFDQDPVNGTVRRCVYTYSAGSNSYVADPARCDAPAASSTTATFLEVYLSDDPPPLPAQDLDVEIVLGPYATPANANPCVTRVCDPATGPLADQPLPAGTSCSGPNDVCRAPSTCNGSGSCTIGAALPNGTSCSNGNVCDGEETCSGGTCAPGTALTATVIDDHDPCTQDSCDPSRGIVNAPIPGCYASTGASPLDGTTARPFGDAIEFLYTGGSPIQTGVAPGTIDKAHVAVIRGRVFDTDGASPATGATVSIVGHPEYGQTTVRADGWYDLAVNGGAPLTVDVQQAGRLRVQRKVLTKWKSFAIAEDMVLTAPYTSADPFVVGAATGQVVRGATTPAAEDADGARRALLYFPPGTRPTNYAVADGTALDVQITEYTRGPDGPRRMPGELPPTSGYTYALEVSLPAAIASGVQDVQFDDQHRVSLYVDDFTGQPVGDSVPLGYYDRTKAAWLGEESGRVIRILSAPTGGQATIDTNGDGVADNDLALDSDELTMLAAQYAPNTRLWRVTVRHFSGWDANWGFGPPDPAPLPPVPAPQDDDPDDPCERSGSVIGCESRTLGEEIPVVGTPYSLHYQSRRSTGYRGRVRFPISAPTGAGSMLRAHIEIEAAGRVFKYVRQPPLPSNEMFTWTWDGLDAYGRLVEQGATDVRIRVGYEYTGTTTFSTPYFGVVATPPVATVGNRASRTVTLWRESSTTVHRADAKALGFGGWTISPNHLFDNYDTVFLGSGRRRTTRAYQIATTAGGGSYSSSYGDGGPATSAYLYAMNAVVAAADGSIYVSHEASNSGGGRIRRVGPDGIITTIAGLPPVVARTDGMPALHAQIWPTHMAVAPDGSLVFAEARDTTGQVWRIEPGPTPTLRLVAGTGVAGPACTLAANWKCLTGEGGPATSADLRSPGSIAVASDGAIFFADNNYRVRRVGPEGVITTYYVDNMGVSGISLRPDGVLFVHQYGSDALIRVEPSGVSSPVVPSLNMQRDWCEFASNGSAIGSFFGVVAPLPDDSFLLSCGSKLVRRMPSSSLLRIAGLPGYSDGGLDGDGGPAIRAKLANAKPLAFLGGDILVGNTNGNNRVRRLSRPMGPSDPAHLRVPSEDGTEVYEFDLGGRHERTLSALRGTALSTFAYDPATHQLTSITDEAGNVTQISRSAGTVTITAPFGQVTTLSLDANGYLASVTSPKSDEVTQLAHTDSGLLTELVDANGHAHHFEYTPDGRLTKDVDATPGSAGQRLAMTETPTAWTIAITSAAGRVTRHTVERSGNFPDRSIRERRHVVTADGLQTNIDKYLDDATSSTRPGGIATTVLDTKPDPRWGTLASFPSSIQTAVGTHTMTRAETRTATLATAGDPFSVSAQTITTTLSASGLANAVTTRTFAVGPPAKWTTTSPAGRQTRETLDSLERVTQLEVLGSSPVTLYPTQIHYDTRGRVDQVTHGTRVFTTSFDPATGWAALTTAPEALGITYAARDANGRPTSIVLPGARTLGVSYDFVGNVLSVTPPSKPAHAFVRTPTNLLATYAPPDLGFSPKNTDYAYDPDGLVLLQRHPGAPTTFTRDGYGRTKTVSDAVTRTFGYNAAGLVESISTSDSVTLTNTFDGTLRTKQTIAGPFTHDVNTAYDNFLRVSSTNIDGANAVTFTRDADGFITNAGGMTASWSTNRLLTSTTAGSITETFTYNGYGERVGQSISGAATGYSVTLTRDGAGRIQEKSETIAGVTHSFRYEYDSAARLAAVYEDGSPTAARSWTYDANGNRSGATYDDQDRLRVLGDFSFEYRENGELSKKIDTSTTPNAETVYTYDPQGNLRAVTRPAPYAAIEYVIDGENRRVGKKVGGALVQGFLYDGPRIVAELDAAGAVVSRFVYVTGGHSPDVMITSAGTFRLVKDHLGSPRLVMNTATGAVAQRLDYDEWGVVTSDTSPGFQPFGFAGGLWDRDTNLVRFGARDYDPTSGRWTTKDRTRFRGGLNLYGYANGDPINFVDVTGYDPTAATLIATGLGTLLGPLVGATSGALAGGLIIGGGGLCLSGILCPGLAPGEPKPPAPPPTPGSGGGPDTPYEPADTDGPDVGPTDSGGGLCWMPDKNKKDERRRNRCIGKMPEASAGRLPEFRIPKLPREVHEWRLSESRDSKETRASTCQGQ